MASQSICNNYMYSQGQNNYYSPEEATIESASPNSSASLSKKLIELSGPSSLSSSAEERRVYAHLSKDKETMLLKIMGRKF